MNGCMTGAELSLSACTVRMLMSLMAVINDDVPLHHDTMKTHQLDTLLILIKHE